MSTTTNEITKTEQRELDSHAKLRGEFSEAFAAVETSEHALDSAEGKKLVSKRERIASRLKIAADKLRKRGYELASDDSTPGEKKEAEMITPTSKPKPAPKAPDFEWPQDGGTALILDYLRESVSADADAPNKGLPFITEGGILRIRAEHWRGWLAAKNLTPSKLESARPIREKLGYSMKPFAIPGENFSHGFYTGAAPKGTEELPRRIIVRAAAGTSKPRTPRNPLKGFSDAQRLYLADLLDRDKRSLKGEAADAHTALKAALDGLRDADAATDAAAASFAANLSASTNGAEGAEGDAEAK